MSKGELFLNEPLAPYTSWRVGGPARQLYKPTNIQDLAEFLQTLPENESIIYLGLGSNLLVRDKGIKGTVIYTQGRLKELAILADGTLRAEAGVTCAKLAKFCARHSLDRSTFFAGIPGTVGGALAMNAGAFGGVTWEHVVAVETIDRAGKLHTRQPNEFEIRYREVKKPAEEWFVAGHFRFAKTDAASGQQAIKELLRKRSETQPIGEFSCGSVFRNPPQDHAARLIEASGLKGYKMGGAWVSEKHANFIINGGNATAKDIETLIGLVQETVEKSQHVSLTPECHIIGEDDE